MKYNKELMCYNLNTAQSENIYIYIYFRANIISPKLFLKKRRVLF